MYIIVLLIVKTQNFLGQLFHISIFILSIYYQGDAGTNEVSDNMLIYMHMCIIVLLIEKTQNFQGQLFHVDLNIFMLLIYYQDNARSNKVSNIMLIIFVDVYYFFINRENPEFLGLVIYEYVMLSIYYQDVTGNVEVVDLISLQYILVIVLLNREQMESGLLELVISYRFNYIYVIY